MLSELLDSIPEFLSSFFVIEMLHVAPGLGKAGGPGRGTRQVHYIKQAPRLDKFSCALFRAPLLPGKEPPNSRVPVGINLDMPQTL